MNDPVPSGTQRNTQLHPCVPTDYVQRVELFNTEALHPKDLITLQV